MKIDWYLIVFGALSLQSFSVLSSDYTTIEQVVNRTILNALVGNSVTIEQKGDDNRAEVYQQGYDSKAIINQNGNGHRAVIRQDGGHHNYAEIRQEGITAKDYEVTQNGDHLGIKIIQQEHQQIIITQTN